MGGSARILVINLAAPDGAGDGAVPVPPTFLLTGTRDLFLSNTARTHIKLRQAGAVADLLVYEGVSHGDYATEAASRWPGCLCSLKIAGVRDGPKNPCNF
jgi:acetyl esterase/lipase